MAFLDSFGAKLTNFGNDVTNRTKNMVEVNNLNSQLKSCEEQLKNYYCEIGRAYYESVDPSTLDSAMLARFAKVDEANEAIEHINNSLRKTKSSVACPKCGSLMPADTVFCSACGVRLDSSFDDTDNSAPEKIKCSQCGQVMKSGAVYCVGCGTKL